MFSNPCGGGCHSSSSSGERGEQFMFCFVFLSRIMSKGPNQRDAAWILEIDMFSGAFSVGICAIQILRFPLNRFLLSWAGLDLLIACTKSNISSLHSLILQFILKLKHKFWSLWGFFAISKKESEICINPIEWH